MRPDIPAAEWQVPVIHFSDYALDLLADVLLDGIERDMTEPDNRPPAGIVSPGVPELHQ
jgi:hypothetical protein